MHRSLFGDSCIESRVCNACRLFTCERLRGRRVFFLVRLDVVLLFSGICILGVLLFFIRITLYCVCLFVFDVDRLSLQLFLLIIFFVCNSLDNRFLSSVVYIVRCWGTVVLNVVFAMRVDYLNVKG